MRKIIVLFFVFILSFGNTIAFTPGLNIIFLSLEKENNEFNLSPELLSEEALEILSSLNEIESILKAKSESENKVNNDSDFNTEPDIDEEINVKEDPELERIREEAQSEFDNAKDLSDKADAQRKIYENSQEYIDKNNAELDYKKSTTLLKSKKSEIKKLENDILILNDSYEELIKLAKNSTDEKESSELSKKASIIREDMVAMARNINKKSIEYDNLEKQDSEKYSLLSDAKLKLSAKTSDLIKSNNDSIREKESSIIDISGLSGAKLESALKENTEIKRSISERYKKNLTLAADTFANSSEGIRLQSAIDNAKNSKERQDAIDKYNEAQNKNQDFSNAKENFDKSQQEAKDARNDFCDETKGCLDQPSFEIKVGTLTPGKLGMDGKNIEERANWVLGTIIQRMMIALGVLSVLIMTIGAGYIILNNGQDELLSKGKSIFMSGIYSILIALSSYFLVAIVRFMLFA